MKNEVKNYFIKTFITCLIVSINYSYAKEFIIGVEEVSYYPLYDFSANDTSRASFSKDLLTAFFDEYNYSYRFVALPIKRFNQWYVENGIDFKFPDNVRWRDEKQNKLNITFSQSVIKLMAGSFVLKKNTQYQKSDIKKLATIFGFALTLWSDEIENDKVEVIEESTPYSIVKHVLYGNVEATNIDYNVIRHALKRLNKPEAIVLNTNIKHEVYSYHLSSIQHPEMIKQFDVFLQNNAKLVQQLKEKYDIVEKFQ